MMASDQKIRAENYERDIMSNVRDIMADEVSVRDLATAIGVHYNTLHSWLNGDRRPPLGALPNLAYALGISMERLMDVRVW